MVLAVEVLSKYSRRPPCLFPHAVQWRNIRRRLFAILYFSFYYSMWRRFCAHFKLAAVLKLLFSLAFKTYLFELFFYKLMNSITYTSRHCLPCNHFKFLGINLYNSFTKRLGLYMYSLKEVQYDCLGGRGEGRERVYLLSGVLFYRCTVKLQ